MCTVEQDRQFVVKICLVDLQWEGENLVILSSSNQSLGSLSSLW